MTGRELMMLILEYKLEDTEVVKDGKFIWFMSEEEAAVKFDVGVSTIRAWYMCKKLDGIKIGDQLYFLRNATDPRKDDKHG